MRSRSVSGSLLQCENAAAANEVLTLTADANIETLLSEWWYLPFNRCCCRPSASISTLSRMRAFSIFVAIVRFIASALNRIVAHGATSGVRLSVEGKREKMVYRVIIIARVVVTVKSRGIRVLGEPLIKLGLMCNGEAYWRRGEKLGWNNIMG